MPMRRQIPIYDIGSGGAAALAAFLLQFFHPFDVTLMDLGTHIAALAVLIAAFSLSGRLGLTGRR